MPAPPMQCVTHTHTHTHKLRVLRTHSDDTDARHPTPTTAETRRKEPYQPSAVPAHRAALGAWGGCLEGVAA